jgi:hypothetical protein
MAVLLPLELLPDSLGELEPDGTLGELLSEALPEALPDSLADVLDGDALDPETLDMEPLDEPVELPLSEETLPEPLEPLDPLSDELDPPLELPPPLSDRLPDVPDPLPLPYGGH